jgi:hypothetical protein
MNIVIAENMYKRMLGAFPWFETLQAVLEHSYHSYVEVALLQYPHFEISLSFTARLGFQIGPLSYISGHILFKVLLPNTIAELHVTVEHNSWALKLCGAPCRRHILVCLLNMSTEEEGMCCPEASLSYSTLNIKFNWPPF